MMRLISCIALFSAVPLSAGAVSIPLNQSISQPEIGETNILLREPGFFKVVDNGLHIAFQTAVSLAILRPVGFPIAIRRAINWTPDYTPKYDLNDFTNLNLTVMLYPPKAPAYTLDVESKGSKANPVWNAWKHELDFLSRRTVSKEIGDLGFDGRIRHIKDQDAALAKLVAHHRPGPYNVIQMCGVRQDGVGKVMYAFGLVSDGGDREHTHWNLVNALSLSLYEYDAGDPCDDAHSLQIPSKKITTSVSNAMNGTIPAS